MRCNKFVNLHKIIPHNSTPLSLLGFSSQGWRSSIRSEVLRFVVFYCMQIFKLLYVKGECTISLWYWKHSFILCVAIIDSSWFFFYYVNLQSGHTWWIHFFLFCHTHPLCACFVISPFLLHLLSHKCKHLNRSMNTRNEKWKEWKYELFVIKQPCTYF